MSPVVRWVWWKVLAAAMVAGLVTAACAAATPSPTAAPPAPASQSPAGAPVVADGRPAPVVTLAAPVGTRSVREIVRDATPSVVQIQTEAVQLDFFNRPIPAGGVGTGEIIDTEGHILTNNHVVAGARKISVTLGDGRALEARLVGTDPSTDLAVLKIEVQGLVPIRIGRSSDLQVGDSVIAIGHALALPGGPTVTGGLVSALGRSIDLSPTSTIGPLIQTDAAINPGNSGGPLLNMNGEMIGVNTARVQAGEGIGFAIAIDSVMPLVGELVASGRIDRGFLGISPANLTQAIAEQLGVPAKEGILVVQVIARSPAERAGLRRGAVIVSIAGKPTNRLSDLESILWQYRKGEMVTVEYYQGKEKKSLDVTLGERPR